MSQITVNSSEVGNAIQEILLSNDIQPGEEPSYNICKLLYLYHPIAKKMVDAPITMAQCQQRIINIQKGPEEKVRTAFLDEWRKIGADRYIANTRRLSRIYGASAIAIKIKGQADDKPLDFDKLADAEISFSVFDPLNIAGSIVLNLQPNAFDFLKTTGIMVQGNHYHDSRTQIMFNEEPIYLAYTTASFGFVGRSVYQRALFPLKSFLSTMITDDMVALKSGVLVAKMKSPGAIIDQVMQLVWAGKRAIVQQAKTKNVISITTDEDIESLNLQNIDGAYGMCRKNILENIATSADMPAIILKEETFAEGFGEGSEDAKHVAQFVDRERITMDPLYRYFDKIVQYRAWNRNFYETIQNLFPEEYSGVDYETAFREWQNSFVANWPNLLEEPDSEKSKSDKVELDAIVEIMEVMLPVMDPENQGRLLQWAADNINDFEMLFGSPLDLDIDTFLEHAKELVEQQKQLAAEPEGPSPGAPKPPNPKPTLSSKDSEWPVTAKDRVARHRIAAIEANMPNTATIKKLITDGLRRANG
jgi:hypothetical protein